MDERNETDYTHLPTIYSSLMVAGSFLYSELESNIMKLFGSVLFFTGLGGLFIIAIDFSKSKYNKIKKLESMVDLLHVSLIFIQSFL